MAKKKLDLEKLDKKIIEEHKKSKKGISFCPKCKSENVENKNTFGLGVTDMPHMRWKCKDCGFEDFIFPIKELNKKLKKDLKNL